MLYETGIGENKTFGKTKIMPTNILQINSLFTEEIEVNSIMSETLEINSRMLPEIDLYSKS